MWSTLDRGGPPRAGGREVTVSSTTTRAGAPAGRTARPSSASIDATIVDVAAGLFAAQGVDGTSLQQVADAVGYSKTGLLHRFPSKQALFDAATTQAERVLSEVLDELSAAAPDLDDGLLRSVARHAVAHPGLVDLVISRLSAVPPVEDRLHGLVVRVIDQLAPDGTPRRRLHVVLALQLIVNAVAAQRDGVLDLVLPADDLVDLAADLAARVLRDAPGTAPAPSPAA
jgi:AcrR family transcriptional regulator